MRNQTYPSWMLGVAIQHFVSNGWYRMMHLMIFWRCSLNHCTYSLKRRIRIENEINTFWSILIFSGYFSLFLNFSAMKLSNATYLPLIIEEREGNYNRTYMISNRNRIIFKYILKDCKKAWNNARSKKGPQVKFPLRNVHLYGFAYEMGNADSCRIERIQSFSDVFSTTKIIAFSFVWHFQAISMDSDMRI